MIPPNYPRKPVTSVSLVKNLFRHIVWGNQKHLKLPSIATPSICMLFVTLGCTTSPSDTSHRQYGQAMRGRICGFEMLAANMGLLA